MIEVGHQCKKCLEQIPMAIHHQRVTHDERSQREETYIPNDEFAKVSDDEHTLIDSNTPVPHKINYLFNLKVKVPRVKISKYVSEYISL